MNSRVRRAREITRRLWRLRPHLRGGRYLLGAVVGTSLTAGLLEGVGVSLLVPLLSLLLGGEGATPMRPISWLHQALPGHTATVYVLVFCGLVLGAIGAKNLVLYTSQLLAARLRRRIATNLRLSLFQRLQQADLHLFERHPAGELANIFFTEIARTISFVEFVLLFGQRASIGVFYFGMLLFISWPLTLITLALAIGSGGLMRSLYRRLAGTGREVVQRNRTLASLVLEAFAGIRVVRATHSEQRQVQRFGVANFAQAEAEERIARTSALLAPLTETVAVAGGMIIVGCAYAVFVRPGLMLSSYLFGFGFVLLRLLPLINQLYGLQGQIISLAGGVLEVEKWLETPQYPMRPFGHARFAEVRESLQFCGLTYIYPNGTRALAGVSFTVPAGKTVALVGRSGSGKSTLAAVLLRFRSPTTGQVLVDGRDYWEFSAETWHKAISVVEQEAFLFHDTLAQNIGYGFPEVSPEAIQRAVALACLEDVVASLPGGLDTVVGERGILLSGGQRQRLAIARAVVRDPRILILDEATSALDSLAERQVQNALERAMHGRTVLVIAHRLSTLRHADQLVVLEQGQVSQQGSWEELSQGDGLFRRFLEASSGKNVLSEPVAGPPP